MREGRTFLDDTSPPGSWRGAINPNGYCKGCGQRDCPCPDAVYAGVVPPVGVGRGSDGAPASALGASFHPALNSPEGQHDHA